MSDAPLVSILICTYNAIPYITETIQSVLAQTHKNMEILVRDNASSDETVSIIQSFHDKRIKLVESKVNLWPYWWLNKLLEQATWKYVAIQDHDDIRHPEKIQKQVAFLEKSSLYVGCWTKTLMWYASDKKWFEYFLGEENYYTIHPSLMFRNKKEYRYPEDRLYMNDAFFQKKILCNGQKKIYNIDEVLTLHRIHTDVKNFSYKRFSYTWKNIKTILYIHPIWYAICVLAIETIRRSLYPLLMYTGKPTLITLIERIPFILQWKKIMDYDQDSLKTLGFVSERLV